MLLPRPTGRQCVDLLDLFGHSATMFALSGSKSSTS